MALNIGPRRVIGLSPGKGGGQAETAFSPAKSKLEAGQNVSLLIITDSTGYTSNGPYYLLGAWLGAQHNATVRLRRWAEWGASADGLGPKEYAAAETLYTGAGPSIDMWLLSLPGSVTASMFDAVRRPAAIDALSRPDCVIWHHGHNMQGYEVVLAGLNSQGRGLYFGPMGMIGYKWPGVPQAFVNQTPWRDTTGMDKIVDALREVKAAKADVTLIDTHSAFLPFKGDALYYRSGEASPGVHPSDASGRNLGAQKQFEVVASTWMNSKALAGFTTSDWVRAAGVNLMPFGDLPWSGSAFTGWSAAGGASLVRNTTDQAPSFSYCMEVQPGATPSTARATRTFTEADTAALRGKTVSVAILAKRTGGQTLPYMSLVSRTQSPPGRTIAMGPLTATAADKPNAGDWNWYVASDIPVDADAAANLMSVSLYPSFNTAGNGGSLFVQKVVIVEGASPKGLMA